MEFVATITVSFLLIGGVMVGISNNFSGIYTGVLQRGYVQANTNCNKKSCSTTYYVREVFTKGHNTTSTCTVERPTPYYFEGDADNFVSRMILGTERKLYQTTYSHGTCLDDALRYQYEVIGYVFLGLSSLIIIPIAGIYGADAVAKLFMAVKPTTTQPFNPLTV